MDVLQQQIAYAPMHSRMDYHRPVKRGQFLGGKALWYADACDVDEW